MKNPDCSKAYDYIRERILSGEFPRNYALKPDLLCKKIKMSRTPVRDALLQLEADGLVTILARMGARVRAIDSNEFNAICGLRMALEVYAAGLAADVRTEADLVAISFAHQNIVNEVEKLIDGSDPASYRLSDLTSEILVREDINFHLAITSSAKNHLIKRAVLQQGLISRIVSASSLLTPDPYLPTTHDELISNLRSTVNEHGIILEAIKIRDTNLAKAAMERHLQQDFATVMRRLSRSEQEHSANDLHFPQRHLPQSRGLKKHAMRSTRSA